MQAIYLLVQQHDGQVSIGLVTLLLHKLTPASKRSTNIDPRPAFQFITLPFPLPTKPWTSYVSLLLQPWRKQTHENKRAGWPVTAEFEEVVGEVTYAVKQSNFVVLFERWLLPAPRSYIVPVKAIQTPSDSGRRLIQPIVSRCTITRVLEIYYEGWKATCCYFKSQPTPSDHLFYLFSWLL